ncbi:MAG: hypothetical protein WBP55_08485 [Solirubrobacterales bacterium]
MKADSGQASIEAVAGMAILLLAGLVCFQLLATGYSATVVDGAATAGAVALVQGKPVDPAVRDALPGWARSRVSVRHLGERVEVTIRPPSPFEALSEHISLTSTASAKPG